MLLPVFLLASLAVFAKQPVGSIVGEWDATIYYKDVKYKGEFTFNHDGTMSQWDNLVFSADWNNIVNIGVIPPGGLIPFPVPIFDLGVGTWEVAGWGADSVEILAVYKKAARINGKSVYTEKGTLKLISVNNGVTKGTLVLELVNAKDGKKKTVNASVNLTKKIGVQH